MMKLNIPNYLFTKTDNIKNKYSKLFIIGYLFSLLKDNNKKYVEFRPSVLFKSFEGLFSKWIIKNTLKQLEEEKIIYVDKEAYSTDRIYKINFTDNFLKEIKEKDFNLIDPYEDMKQFEIEEFDFSEIEKIGDFSEIEEE